MFVCTDRKDVISGKETSLRNCIILGRAISVSEYFDQL